MKDFILIPNSIFLIVFDLELVGFCDLDTN